MVGLIRNMGILSARKDPQLGILAFEAAKTMSRLISLYKSLTDAEISRLSNDVVKSRGVAYLNSRDEAFLLRLAWAERLEDLDHAAAAVARIGKKCTDFGLNRFDILYRDLKLGIVDLGNLDYGSKAVEKKVRKMEKLVATTSSLHSALEALTELEISERKLKQWKNRPTEKEKVLIFYQKLENQRREVRNFREVSLWSKSFDKTVDLMVRIACVVHARILQVSGRRRRRSSDVEKIIPHSGPILPTSKPTIVRFYSRRIDGGEKAFTVNKVFHAAGPGTVGGSGLALRYANVLLLAEKHLNSTAAVSQQERESLYEMLPESLKALVGAKLSRNMKRAEAEGGGAALAEGWRDAVGEMLAWLAPMARDTVAWQVERAFEKMRFEAAPAALLLQTLHFADREKVEAAIAEVLVGLSCIFRFENRLIRD